MTALAEEKRGINNYNIAVREYGDKIIFLRQILPGATDRSYGIHVAQLAGLPKDVISRAGEILENLESSSAEPMRNNTLPENSNLTEIARHQRGRRTLNAAENDEQENYQMRLF